jgi:predicted ATPase
MKIKDFNFSSDNQDWNIDKIYFDDLNLLVGASGVGKTRILRALDLICDVAKDKTQKLDDVQWSINFSHLGKDYRWDLKASNSNDESFSSDGDQSEIFYERLVEFRDGSEIEILHRSNLESRLNNQKLPKLKKTESAIVLLSEEDSITPIAEAFKRFIFFKEIPQQAFVVMPFNLNDLLLIKNSDIAVPTSTVTTFKESNVDAPTVIKAYLLQKLFPKEFKKIRDTYIEIFPNVEDIRVEVRQGTSDEYGLLFEIKEIALEKWIPQNRISSGMLRTLVHLVEILTAPEESVIVIDEFENSLGINCMPELTEFILERSPELQFILTSHHPYIINSIPWTNWQVVSKVKSKIIARKTTDIPELETASSLDKFTQLIDLLESEGEVA